MGDPATQKKYVDAIASALSQWNVGQIQGWIDTWSQQISDAATSDPHAWATPAQFHDAVTTLHDIVKQRADFLQTFVDCERSGKSGC